MAALFVASWYVPRREGQVMRVLVAFLPVAVLMFAAELTAEPSQRLTRNGRWRIRRVRIEGRKVVGGLGRLVVEGLVVVVAFRTLLHTMHPSGAAGNVLRLVAGVGLLYAGAAFVFEACGLGCLMCGYSVPVLHRAPIFARSIGEFWARRWNIVVSSWLRTFVFRPVARHGYARAGILCAFVVSGFFHSWPMLAGLGVSAAGRTMAFFLIQGVVVLNENGVGIHAWPATLARTWTIFILLASSPLFVDPALRAFGL